MTAGDGGDGGERRRLFFALDPDPLTRARLASHLLPATRAIGGRPVPPERWHLTLVFLGSVPAERLPCIESAAAGVRLGRFDLVLDHIGYWRRAEVLWAGIRPCAVLQDLHVALRDALVDCGIPPEERPYRPHLTLVRRLTRPPRPLTVETIAWPVIDFVLMETTAAGYQRLRQWPLGA